MNQPWTSIIRNGIQKGCVTFRGQKLKRCNIQPADPLIFPFKSGVDHLRCATPGGDNVYASVNGVMDRGCCAKGEPRPVGAPRYLPKFTLIVDFSKDRKSVV